MSCAQAVLEAPALDREAPSEPGSPCLRAHTEVAGRGSVSVPDDGIARTLTVPRARLELGLGLGDRVGTRVAWSAVRSGGEDGYTGIDGESLVAGLVVAEGRWAAPKLGFAVGAGVIDDPWVLSGEQAVGFRELVPTLGEQEGWMDRADLGGWVGFGAPAHVASLRVDLTAGEGSRYRERNEGKNTAITLRVLPFALAGVPERLVVTAYGRDGSRGLTLVRDHRLGARVHGEIGPLEAGVEGLVCWGVDGDALREPRGVSAWTTLQFGELMAGDVDVPVPLVVFARADLIAEARDNPDAGTLQTVLATGVELPAVSGAGEHRPVRVLVGWKGRNTGSAVREVAGAEALATTHEVFVSIGVNLQGQTALAPM